MRIRDALASAAIPRLEAEVLLCHVLGTQRTWLAAHDEEEVRESAALQFEDAVKRRRHGEPVAYIVGEKEFYGRPFAVSPSVLIPRPATESLIKEALSAMNGAWGQVTEADTGISILTAKLHEVTPRVIVDAGTGSGIVAITLALEGWRGGVYGVDTSSEALVIAAENVQLHGLGPRVTLVHEDAPAFIKRLAEPFLVVSNPPYIPSGTTLMDSVAKYEPHEALFAGSDGLTVIRGIAKSARENDLCAGVTLELRTDQVDHVRGLLR